MQFYFCFFTFFIGVILVKNGLAQTADSTKEDSVKGTIKNIPYTYSEHIKTVLIYPENAPVEEPVIALNSPRKIVLTFDDLGDNYTEYYFQLILCDAQWNPSSADKIEFIESNLSNTIEQYEFSSKTSVGYTHYRLELPREYEQFKRSGNYLIHVFERSSDSIVLTQRFMVQEYGINISGNVGKPDDVTKADFSQQIRFHLTDPKQIIQDQSRLYVTIRKNRSWDIVCEDPKVSFVSGDKIVFERVEQCVFEGGNEYRSINFIDLKSISSNIARINFRPHQYYEIWLDPDKPRSYLQYVTGDDINGNIRYTGDHKDFLPYDLDYVNTHFYLKTEDPMLGYEIYLYGAISDNRLNRKFKLEYSPETEMYELTTLLKQGYYNYQYVVKSIYQESPDEGLLEGSHAQTENNYSIFVYYKDLSGFERLIGYEQLNSHTRTNQLIKNN